LIVKAGFHTGFTIRVLRKEFRGDEPGRTRMLGTASRSQRLR
jgi:hypothetical protein